MINFPVPYETEAIYSVIARAGVYQALTSPKQLLDEVFQDRKVVATMDLPCNLSKIQVHLERTGQYDLEKLIYRHTIFPLYAVFVPENVREKAIDLMAFSSGGVVHLMLGVAASVIKYNDQFKYCPQCMQSQLAECGEVYWKREWYLPGMPFCIHHGALEELDHSIKEHRHTFQSASSLVRPNAFQITPQSQSDSYVEVCRWLTKSALELLVLPPMSSPSYEQWTIFYKKIALDNGCNKGSFCCHGSILEYFSAGVPLTLLQQLGLFEGLEKETGWLRAIFRKHRKSFSYLQHMLIWSVFLPKLSVSEVLNQVSAISADNIPKKNRKKSHIHIINELPERRASWDRLACEFGVKLARKCKEGGALYAWLYRHDSDWLLSTNLCYKKQDSSPRLEKINWRARDVDQTKALFRILYKSELNSPDQRMSSNWFLKKIGRESSNQFNREKLPLTWMFLSAYSESVSEHQLRRVSKYCYECSKKNQDIQLWRLLRGTGLSEVRITSETRTVLLLLGYIDS
ncbi:hypothetical protein A8139_20975 [Marinomonas primoryensis]|uniref:Uncharacterized protein n=1 Tax=Marinomonas primoryensis TaxID=178399 RepID=A0A2Z4PYJ2_9GAMM|nr:TnsD family Tn7-like transposition protein [Marinomonas primoryensis]AWY02134.1 hypothetical protein A8139_20975 [Marinomonas primoryensis]